MFMGILSITPNGLLSGGASLKGEVRLYEDAPDDAREAEVVRGKVCERYMGRTDGSVKDGDAPFTPLWGTDVLIRDADNGTPSGLAMDVADNGDVYVAVLMKGPGYRDDTLEVWKSTDGGYTWTRNTDMDVIGEIDHNGIDLAVGPGANPWVYTVINWDDSSTTTVGQGVYLRRLRADISAYDWVEIVSGDTVDRPRISVNNDGHVAITYITDNGRVYRGVSTDEGLTWNVFWASTNTTWSEIYISDNGRGYHTYVRLDTAVRVVTFNAPNITADDITTLQLPDTARHVSITASGGAVSSQEAVVVWANRHPSSDVWDVHYSYSTDGGTTWATPDVFQPTAFPYPSGAYMNYPYVHRDRNSTSFRFVVTFISSWDTVFYAHSTSANGWTSSREAINDHDGTTSFGAVVDYCPGVGGGCVVYREFASDRVWFDGWGFTEVEERTTVDGPPVYTVRGGIKAEREVSVYSIGGRLVVSGKGFLKLKRGVYFVRYGRTTLKTIVR